MRNALTEGASSLWGGSQSDVVTQALVGARLRGINAADENTESTDRKLAPTGCSSPRTDFVGY